MAIFDIVGMCIIIVAVLGIFLKKGGYSDTIKSYLKKKTSAQILLLGIELTLVGGIFIIGLKDELDSIVAFGIILVIIGLITSILGFFLKNEME